MEPATRCFHVSHCLGGGPGIYRELAISNLNQFHKHEFAAPAHYCNACLSSSPRRGECCRPVCGAWPSRQCAEVRIPAVVREQTHLLGFSPLPRSPTRCHHCPARRAVRSSNVNTQRHTHLTCACDRMERTYGVDLCVSPHPSVFGDVVPFPIAPLPPSLYFYAAPKSLLTRTRCNRTQDGA